ncbi:MAG: hypothetical protein M1823_003838 [Watsoniomyces obsoletus]|nr:MAG: hypothetical protein M1823_003838 [Watsoniomyces obsoletus]
MAKSVDLPSDGPEDDSADEHQLVGVARPLTSAKELQKPTSDEESDNEESEENAWESDSLYADALDGMTNSHSTEPSEDSCTAGEATAYRRHLRAVGSDRFFKETVDTGTITAKKLCTAFDIRLPAFLEGAPDEAYYPLLGLGISRELSKRIKLPQYNTIDHAVKLLRESKNIIVLTGAGISTSLGIPDFRSKDTGLYSKLEHLGLSDPQEVFDINLFRQDPSIFYSVAKDILPATDRYTPTHAFIRLLQDRKKLLTNYSQNIDDIESKAGIRPEKLIQCHGSFATASCLACSNQVKCEEIFDKLKAGKLAYCRACTGRRSQTGGLKRKREAGRANVGNGNGKMRRKCRGPESDTDEGEDDGDGGDLISVMKPDITFFGEALPGIFHDRLVKHDRDKVDLVIVIGTSLKVAPVSEIVGFLPPNVPQIYISREPVSHIDFDIELLGDCDVVVAELCRRAGWNLTHEMIPPEQKVNVELLEGHESRYSFTVAAGN